MTSTDLQYKSPISWTKIKSLKINHEENKEFFFYKFNRNLKLKMNRINPNFSSFQKNQESRILF